MDTTAIAKAAGVSTRLVFYVLDKGKGWVPRLRSMHFGKRHVRDYDGPAALATAIAATLLHDGVSYATVRLLMEQIAPEKRRVGFPYDCNMLWREHPSPPLIIYGKQAFGVEGKELFLLESGRAIYQIPAHTVEIRVNLQAIGDSLRQYL